MPSSQDYFGSFTDARDRRQYPRKATGLNCVTLGDSTGGIVLNISEDGLALTAVEPLVEGFIPRAGFQLEEGARWIEASGRIVWLSRSKKGAGIQFVDLAEEDRHQIRQWISSKSSPSEIEDASMTVRKRWHETEAPPPPPQSRNEAPKLETLDKVDEVHEAQSEKLFPSESAPPLQASVPPEPPPIPLTNSSPLTNGLPEHSLPVPDFGYHTRSDWSDWPDPATAERRSKVPLVVLGVLTATSFVIGAALGHGSFKGFLESVRRLMPDKIQPGPSVAAPPPPAGSLTAHSSPSAVDAPAPDVDTSPSETPASPNPAVPAGRNEEKQATVTRSDVAGAASSAESKSATRHEDRAPILVAAAGEGGRPLRLTTPATAVSASSTVAISSQTSILVPREAGAKIAQQPKRLQPGVLIFHVEPQHPRGLGQKEIEIVKLRATVGENGQVIGVQRVSGPMPLASTAMSAIREWRYSPTLFNGHPVKTEEENTIAFRAR